MGHTGSVDAHPEVPAAERDFYVAEFAGSTIVVSLPGGDLGSDAVGLVATSLAGGDARLVLVTGAERDTQGPAGARRPVEGIAADAPVVSIGDGLDPSRLGELWLTVSDARVVVVESTSPHTATVAAGIAAALRALKLVITDDRGGWGRPPRSLADVRTHRDAYRSQLADRQDATVVEALEVALAGGVASVNLCRAEDLYLELFTFDGTGTLFTSGGYVEVSTLRIDDLAAVEELVAQGISDGLLRPRDRLEVAAMAATGLGARVVGSGHLAGIVGLETDAYLAQGLGEVSALYTVSRFSGSGAGGLLVDGLVERAVEAGLRALFAVTVAEPAASLFLRKGFAEVSPAVLPEEKWTGYDVTRRSEARAFWLDLDQSGGPASATSSPTH